MKPGDYVLDLLKEAPQRGRTIALIRHSKRNSFDGVPHHLREGVEITPEGILMARGFGESLGKIHPGKSLFLGHTVAKRCRMTAESICKGYPPYPPARILGCEPEIKSPVVNLDAIFALMNEFGGVEVVRRWINQEIPEDTMHNPHRYADDVLGTLLSFPGIEEKDLLVVIAHDVTILPIVFSVFGKTLHEIEFLNGIVIMADTDTAEIRYTDAELSLKAEQKIV